MTVPPHRAPGPRDPAHAKAQRLYTLLLYLYPARAREQMGPELLELFHYRRVQWMKSGRTVGLAFWWAMFRDTSWAAWRERRHPLCDRRPTIRNNRGGDGMKGWIDDFRHAARRLRRSPGFTLTALTILILGIGVNSTAFSVVNALLLQAPPFDEPDRIVTILQDGDGGEPSSTSYPAYLDITRTPGVFTSVSAHYADQGFLQQDGTLTPLLLEYATAPYLEVIGLAPVRGTWFAEEHDDPNGPPVAVLTYHMWMDRLAGDPDVLGTTIRINGAAVQVIGVGPADFNGGAGPARTDLWLSVSAMDATGGRAPSLTRRQDHPFVVRARLADGMGIDQAQSAMDRLAAELARTYPELNTGRRINVLPVQAARMTREAEARLVPGALFSMLVVGMVLLIGTLNLANLLLVRSTGQAREVAVRLALGSGRARVIRVVLAEALLLSAAGGAGGFALAWGTSLGIRNSRFDFVLPLALDLRLDARVVVFTAVVSLLTGLLFGMIPAVRATRRDVNAILRSATARRLGGRRRFGMTNLLVSAQVAASLLLLVVAAVFVDSLGQAQNADPGFDWERTAYLSVNATPLELDDESTIRLFEDLEARLERLPGVTAATTALMLPAAQLGTSTLLLGSGSGGVDEPTEVPWNYVSIDYFDVLGIPLLHGRYLADTDLDGPGVAVVNEAFARTYWGRTDVVGESYRSEGAPDAPQEIVGVVGDATVRSLSEAPTPAIYWPLDFAYPRMHFVLGVDGATDAVIAGARPIVQAADSRLLITAAGDMGDFLGGTLAQQRLAGQILSLLGGLALILALLGIYGVVSFAVSRRQQEVGVRMALGADGLTVITLFVREVLMVVLIGAVVGVGLAIPVGQIVSSQFTGVTPGFLSIGMVATLLLATSVIATVVPAARAARTNPTGALRQE